MAFLKDQVGKAVRQAAKKLFPEAEFEPKVEYPGDPARGDYAVAVFELAKIAKKNPNEVAKDLIKAIKLPREFSKVEIAGSAFLNFFLEPEFLTKFLEEILSAGEHFGHSDLMKGKTVVTDTSHPNIAKPMGIHHILSTIIGNAINRILAAAGYKVIRDNYLGDWGTQFGKLIYAYKTWGNREVIAKNPIDELLKLYVKFHDEAEHDPVLEEKGRAEFRKMEDGDKENRKLWEWIVDLSLKEFQKMYDRLGVGFDYIHGESFYEDKMREIIDLGVKKGVFVEGEGGSLIAPLKDPNMPPCLIKKSDGATLYATRDLARTKYWEDAWHPSLMIMVADSAQTLHFKQFFEVAGKLGITSAPNIHVQFGRMRFPKKKMSTRKGNILRLEEVLDEAEERAYKIVKEKNPDLNEEAKKEVARQVGIGAVKYAVLSQNRLTDIVFTWDKMLSLEGNSAPYLQYVYARGRSILRKAGAIASLCHPELVEGSKDYILKEPQEIALARLLPKLPEVVAEAAVEFKPNLIANYLFELANRFNGFYASVPVLQAEDESQKQTRLLLVEAVTVALKNGLNLLGIEAPEEM